MFAFCCAGVGWPFCSWPFLLKEAALLGVIGGGGVGVGGAFASWLSAALAFFLLAGAFCKMVSTLIKTSSVISRTFFPVSFLFAGLPLLP